MSPLQRGNINYIMMPVTIHMNKMVTEQSSRQNWEKEFNDSTKFFYSSEATHF